MFSFLCFLPLNPLSLLCKDLCDPLVDWINFIGVLLSIIYVSIVYVWQCKDEWQYATFVDQSGILFSVEKDLFKASWNFESYIFPILVPYFRLLPCICWLLFEGFLFKVGGLIKSWNYHRSMNTRGCVLEKIVREISWRNRKWMN